MRFEIAPLLLAASITGTVAMPQAPSIGSLSLCAQQAAYGLIQSLGCTLTNYNCMCNQPGILDRVRNTLNGQCGSSDASAAVAFAQAQCAALGVNLVETTNTAPQVISTSVVPSLTVTSTLMPVSPKISTSLPASAGVSIPTMAPARNATWNGTMIAPAPFTGSADNMKMGGIAAGLLGVAVAFAML